MFAVLCFLYLLRGKCQITLCLFVLLIMLYYCICLISQAVSDGSTVSSLIADRWFVRKLAIFMGWTGPLES